VSEGVLPQGLNTGWVLQENLAGTAMPWRDAPLLQGVCGLVGYRLTQGECVF
jgi:hypothetical protein